MHAKLIIAGVFIVSLVAIGSLSSCRSEPVIPQTPEVSFSAQVQPLIAGKCGASGCHGTSNPHFGLVTYNDVRAHVAPKDAHKSEVYDAITRFTGDTRMPPKPANQLTDEQIMVIYVWIMQGAKDN